MFNKSTGEETLLNFETAEIQQESGSSSRIVVRHDVFSGKHKEKTMERL